MIDKFSRTGLLLGEDAMKKLASSKVAIFGVGGVGGYALEALVRSGVGEIDIIDNDTISITNLNRQIIATVDTIGKDKVQVAKDRAKSINPDVIINCHNTFYLPETSEEFNFEKYDYIIDAIDTVSGKISLVEKANRQNTKIISSMGAGNKLDPTAFEVSDIYKTQVCPLAKVMRYELKKRGIKKLKVVYSKEIPIKPLQSEEVTSKRVTPGSVSFVPSVVGLIIAAQVIKDLISEE